MAGLAIDPATGPGTSLGKGALGNSRPANNSGTSLPVFNFDLSGAEYQNLPSLTIRVYFYTPTTNQNIDVDNIVFSGEVAAVPEPGVLAGGLMAAGAALMRRRRSI